MREASKLIDGLWLEVKTLADFYERIRENAHGINPAVAGLIGKEIFMRQRVVSTSAFATAVFLATNGEAGNDSLVDFIDCVSILPSVRYARIVSDHDSLIDDPVSSEFGEYGFYSFFDGRFGSVFGEEGDGLLRLLVEREEDFMHVDEAGNVDAAHTFPRLFHRSGHLLSRGASEYCSADRTSLDEFFGENK